MGVSGQVWQSLDHSAGELTRRTRRRILALTAGIIVVMLAVGWIYGTGLIIPHVKGEERAWDGSIRLGSLRFQPPATKSVSSTIRLRNDGGKPADITGAGAGLPGMRFTHLTRHGLGQDTDGVFRSRDWPVHLPLTLKPHEDMSITLHYTVTDCLAVPVAPQRIPVRIARPWGEYVIHVQPPPLRPQNGGWAITTRDDPHHIEWQRFLADDVCGTRSESAG